MKRKREMPRMRYCFREVANLVRGLGLEVWGVFTAG